MRPVVDRARLTEPAEQALFEALQKVVPRSDDAFKMGDYTASLQALANDPPITVFAPRRRQ